MTLAQVMEMDVDEFRGWMAFGEIEPFGGTAADVRWARLTALQANVWGGDASPDDFLLGDEPRPRTEQTKAVANENLHSYAVSLCPGYGY